MSTSLENSFIKQFEQEVHQAYQRQGSKLRGAVRTVSDVKGASTTFQKVGKGVASTKSTHGMLPVMNLDHTAVECILQDYYAGDWVDRLDELKMQTDERMIIANAGAYALGRKTDELIINALDTASTNVIADDSDGLTKAKVLEAFELLGENDVPDDGQRYAVIGWKQWSDLLAICRKFANFFIPMLNKPIPQPTLRCFHVISSKTRLTKTMIRNAACSSLRVVMANSQRSPYTARNKSQHGRCMTRSAM
ncbi:MAG: phage capsid protein [Alphaproteobacteria bacterium]|nr:phage capsid protein [Alphaproteobacteria bacterium]